MNDDLIIENTNLVYFVLKRMGLLDSPNFEDLYEERINWADTSS